MPRPGLHRRLAAAEQDRPATQAWWSPVGRPDDAAPGVPDPRPAADLDQPTVELTLPGLADADTGPLPGVAPAGEPVRVPRAPRPGALPPARALAGAAVAVAGVLLGIGTLLWATDAPDGDPALRPPAGIGEDGSDEPAVALPPEREPAATAPVDVQPPPEPAVEALPPAPPPPAPPEAAPPARPAVEPVPVLVLNNSRVEGLAARAAATFERGGWPVRDTGGLRGRIRATTIYYPPGQEAVAREFARRFDGIERVLPRLPGLPGTGLTVVVTRDFRP